jgi:hypothetical protein
MNATLGVRRVVCRSIGTEFSLIPSGMVRKPQGKPVIDRKDMEAVTEKVPPGCEAPLD